MIWALRPQVWLLGSFPPSSAPELVGWQALMVFQNRWLSSGSPVVTVGKYILFHVRINNKLRQRRKKEYRIYYDKCTWRNLVDGFLTRRQRREYFEGRNKYIGIESLDLEYSLPPIFDRQAIPVFLKPSKSLAFLGSPPDFWARKHNLVLWALSIYIYPSLKTPFHLNSELCWAHPICSTRL